MRKIKFLFLLGLFWMVSIGASAYDFSALNADGVEIYYYITSSTDLTCEVTWGGFSSKSALYYGIVNIPKSVSYNSKTYSVTSIGNYAFCDCSGLTSVTIPNSVTWIGDVAFEGCSGLTSIVVDRDNRVYDSRDNSNAIIETATNTLITGCMNTIIPNSVTSIGYRAFFKCSGLTSVTIPNSVTSIGEDAFWNCKGLTSVTIGNSVESIGDDAFEHCTGLAAVNITDLDKWAEIEFGSSEANPLYYAKKLYLNGELVTDAKLTYAKKTGSYAFEYCSGLKSITIPNSVESIGYCAFSGCSGLTSIVVESGNKYYDSRENCNAIIETSSNTLIQGCKNTIIPNSVTSIGDYAFYDCKYLTSVIIPNSVKSIERYAFYCCNGLTSIAIPNSVTSIGDYAFFVCESLTSVTIGNSVESIGEDSFSGCSGLTSIEIPNSVSSIGDDAFSCCSGLTSVTIPNSVTSIGGCAFRDCTGLTSVTIGNSVTSIGGGAFSDCSCLAAVNITDLDKWAEIEFGSSDANPLYYAKKLYLNGELVTDAKLTSATKIGSCAFNGCIGLTSITIPNSMTSIGYQAFDQCHGLTSVSIGNSVKSIGDYAFSGCTGLMSIVIPNSVTSIGYQAFYDCSGLTSVTNLATTPQVISYYTFETYGTLHVIKGYKDIYEAADVWKYFTIVDDVGDPAGIEEIGLSPALSTREGATYNLQGMKVNGQQSTVNGLRGIVIKNGRKYLKR